MDDMYDKVNKSDNLLKPSQLFELDVMKRLKAIEQLMSGILQAIHDTRDLLSQPQLSILDITTMCTQFESNIAQMKQSNADQEEIKEAEKTMLVFSKYRDKMNKDIASRILSESGLKLKSNAP